MDWAVLNEGDLSHVKEGFASCIGERQQLRLSNGDALSANAIAEAVKAGHRVDFRTQDLGGLGECRNPVIGVVRTRARGVRIVFDGGSAVELTTGHVLPLDAEWREGFSSVEEDDCPIRQQWILRAGQVKPGMTLLDGRVQSVQALGTIRAVRLWTAHPAWITTVDGLRIGSRWHEVVHAWTEVFPGEDDIIPLSACGWLWGNGQKFRERYWESHNVRSRRYPSRYLDADGTRVSARIDGLGSASIIRAVIERRWSGATVMPQWYMPRALRAGMNHPAAEPIRHLRLVRPERLTELLITGTEVVGAPVVADYVAIAA